MSERERDIGSKGGMERGQVKVSDLIIQRREVDGRRRREGLWISEYVGVRLEVS